MSSSRDLQLAVIAGAVAGAALTWLFTGRLLKRALSPGKQATVARESLPKRIILVRHGESEGNADHTLYRTKADNLIELTDRGEEQATYLGKRLKKLLGNDLVHLVVSPFERTLQTARCIRVALEENIVHTYVEPRVREQEFGNLQGDEFLTFRQEQQRVGRFFYRFPTGESGADVHARVVQWWESWVRTVNLRPAIEPVDALVVVCHGLTMRMILMQLYGWSPNTFATIWNAGNCDAYVLKLDLTRPGHTPYKLDRSELDAPRSTLDVVVSFVDGSERTLKLDDYLSIAPPRSTRPDEAADMLAKQHSLDRSTIQAIDFFAGRTGYNKELVAPVHRRTSASVTESSRSSAVSAPSLQPHGSEGMAQDVPPAAAPFRDVSGYSHSARRESR